MWLTADLITSVAPSHLCCAGCSWLEPYLDHQALLPGSLMRCNSALCRRRSTRLQHVWWKTKHMLSDAAIINIPDSLTLYWSCNYFVVVRMNGGHLCWNDTRQTSPTFFCYSDLPQNCRKCKVMTSLDIKTHTHKKKGAVDLQTPASIRQLNGAQVPHHLFLPGFSQRDLSHMARDQETWSTEMDTHNRGRPID